MPVEIKIPEVGESITEVEIGGWLKAKGQRVRKDEPLVTLESEKATVELPAPDSGTITQLLKQKGDVAKVGEVIAYLESDGQTEAARMPTEQKSAEVGGQRPEVRGPTSDLRAPTSDLRAPAPISHLPSPLSRPSSSPAPEKKPADREEEVVPMTRLRRTVAERLVEAQHHAALLTTFNEVDMAGVIALRKEYGEAFQQKYQVKLGFMSFFVKACVDALKLYPAVNAEVRLPAVAAAAQAGDANIVYHNYCDIGVAVGSGKGLVVPVLRNAERMSFAEIEVAIGDFAQRAQDNKLKVEELHGGTFTISNGGVYGSLLSTPIVNPPQSGVLGMHAIQERPVAREGTVVIRPMMYVALTYDHRIVDGREGVSFLRRIKQVVENPARMLMEI